MRIFACALLVGTTFYISVAAKDQASEEAAAKLADFAEELTPVETPPELEHPCLCDASSGTGVASLAFCLCDSLCAVVTEGPLPVSGTEGVVAIAMKTADCLQGIVPVSDDQGEPEPDVDTEAEDYIEIFEEEFEAALDRIISMDAINLAAESLSPHGTLEDWITNAESEDEAMLIMERLFLESLENWKDQFGSQVREDVLLDMQERLRIRWRIDLERHWGRPMPTPIPPPTFP